MDAESAFIHNVLARVKLDNVVRTGCLAGPAAITGVFVNEAKNKIVWFYNNSVIVFSFDGRFVFEYSESPDGDILNVEPYTTPATAYVNVDNPIGGEVLEPGTFNNIYWSHVDLRSVRIDYSSDGGSSWKNISHNYDANMGWYEWKVPDIESSQCLVRIRDGDNNAVRDVSDNFFSITSELWIFMAWRYKRI